MNASSLGHVMDCRRKDNRWSVPNGEAGVTEQVSQLKHQGVTPIGRDGGEGRVYTVQLCIRMGRAPSMTKASYNMDKKQSLPPYSYFTADLSKRGRWYLRGDSATLPGCATPE